MMGDNSTERKKESKVETIELPEQGLTCSNVIGCLNT